MAEFITCADCGKQVSGEEKSCPHCGKLQKAAVNSGVRGVARIIVALVCSYAAIHAMTYKIGFMYLVAVMFALIFVLLCLPYKKWLH